MFTLIYFPVSDLRLLHHEKLGRLEKPRWGSINPDAQFMRGFGKLHKRTQSSASLAGENYYCDFDNAVRFPNLLFVQPCEGAESIWMPLMFRRFYFDGVITGRFEFGFRIDEADASDAQLREPSIYYDPEFIANQVLNQEVVIHCVDGRIEASILAAAGDALASTYLASTTKNLKLKEYPIGEIGLQYVSVGQPHVHIRLSQGKRMSTKKGRRYLSNTEGSRFFVAPSGINREIFDVFAQESDSKSNAEKVEERFRRVVYTHFSCILHSHNYFVSKEKSGMIDAKPDLLLHSLSMMLKTYAELEPLPESEGDQAFCEALLGFVAATDIDKDALASEIMKIIDGQPNKDWLRTPWSWVDQKIDRAIEAAAARAMEIAMRGG